MKGQILWTRPSSEADAADLAAFYSAERAKPPDVSLEGRIGKVAGTVVAHIAWSVNERTLLLQHLYVAGDLRRKRIGRWMLDEVEKLAAGMHCGWIAADVQCELGEFLLKQGFEKRAGRIVKEVRRSML